MEQSDLLRYLVEAVERLGISYIVTGSVATIFYGEPRYTNDIDVVADLPPGRIAAFCSAFGPEDFYLSAEAVRQAAAAHGQFNIIHPHSGLKIDVMVPHDAPFNRSRFARAKRVRPAKDYEASFASPEDVIIKKMEYYREGQSEKHLRDITGVLRVSGDSLDEAYVSEWAGRLGLDAIWTAVLARAQRQPERGRGEDRQ